MSTIIKKLLLLVTYLFISTPLATVAMEHTTRKRAEAEDTSSHCLSVDRLMEALNELANGNVAIVRHKLAPYGTKRYWLIDIEDSWQLIEAALEHHETIDAAQFVSLLQKLQRNNIFLSASMPQSNDSFVVEEIKDLFFTIEHKQPSPPSKELIYHALEEHFAYYRQQLAATTTPLTLVHFGSFMSKFIAASPTTLHALATVYNCCMWPAIRYAIARTVTISPNVYQRAAPGSIGEQYILYCPETTKRVIQALATYCCSNPFANQQLLITLLLQKRIILTTESFNPNHERRLFKNNQAILVAPSCSMEPLITELERLEPALATKVVERMRWSHEELASQLSDSKDREIADSLVWTIFLLDGYCQQMAAQVNLIDQLSYNDNRAQIE
ncbi:hypothetical protein M1466_00320 [Candidatus Dependentiae bacterium]|nr:hypothetical protein [Candidatus Dependentiae bacterium]